MVRILTTTTLYPNEVQIRHGIFVEQRLRRLVESGEVEVKVVAPVPWFPFSSAIFGKYGKYAKVPRRERRWGINVDHPRYLTIPKIGMLVQPILLAVCVFFASLRVARKGFEYDLIDAHYFYPDGVAAAIVGMLLRKPLVITARGSDINLIANLKWPRKMIRWAAERSDGVIAVSNALKNTLVAIGINPDKVSVLRNGVDLDLFHVSGRSDHHLGDNAGICELLSIGNLNRDKGHHIVIEALRTLPGTRLTIVGDGEERTSLETLAKNHGVGDRVTFVESVPQEQLPDYYQAADILVLASEREGMPNVILEALACGIPVIATAVGGIPEVVCSKHAGILVDDRSSNAIVQAVGKLLANYPKRADTRRYAKNFAWKDSTERQIQLYRKIVQQQGAGLDS